MIITSTALTILLTTLKGEFSQQLQLLDDTSFHKIVATVINSNSKSNTYGWLGRFPQLREWVGDRVFEHIKSSSYVIENKRYEATLNVEREDIEDDNMGMYRPMARAMADEMIAFLNRNLAALLKDGFINVCYDGQKFFDEHPVYPKADGTGTAVNVSNIYVAIQSISRQAHPPR